MLRGSAQAVGPAQALKLIILGAMLIPVLALPGCGGGGSTNSISTQSHPVPSITSISPTAATVGGPSFSLRITGARFISSSVVRWNGSAKVTSFINNKTLSAAIDPADFAAAGTASVTVFNPAPGGGVSNATTFSVTNPVPLLTSISPSSAVADQASFPLVVTGRSFVSTSVVKWNGLALATTYNSSSQLTATVSADDLTSVGTAQITVSNPSPGGGVSNAVGLSVTAPNPVKLLTTALPPTGGNKSYYFIPAATGGAPPYTWSIPSGSLPSGLALDPTTGLLSGTVSPSAVGASSPFTLQVEDSLATPQKGTQSLSISVLASLPRNDDPPPCGSASDTATPISNGRLRASISPFGDVDVYSFHGTAGSEVTLETFAERLDLFGDGLRHSFLDSFLELLDGGCNQIALDDDIIANGVHTTQDSLIDFTLPANGTYYIRVRDLRGDGRPDLIYELSLSGAD